jgi:hypothetical protein
MRVTAKESPELTFLWNSWNPVKACFPWRTALFYFACLSSAYISERRCDSSMAVGSLAKLLDLARPHLNMPLAKRQKFNTVK